MVESQFLGIETMCCSVENNAKQHIEEIQRSLLQLEYTKDTAYTFLDTIYRLSKYHQRLEHFQDREALLDLLEAIKPKVPERVEDVEIVSMLIRNGIMRNKGEHSERLPLFKACIHYAIEKGKKFLLARELNDLGSYYQILHHDDLACAAYLMSANTIFEARRECSEDEYRAMLMFPVSNMLSTMGQWGDYIPLKKKLFELDILDISVRSFFGEELESYDSNGHDDEFAYDKELYQKIRDEFYGVEGWKCFIDKVIDEYQNNRDNLSVFITEHESEASQYDVILSRIWDEEANGLSKMIPSMTIDFFFRNLDLISIHYDSLSREDKNALIELLLKSIRCAHSQLSYEDGRVILEDLISGKSLFSKQNAGILLLEHAGDNGAYEEAMSIFQLIKDYRGFPEGKKWLRDAVAHMGLPEDLSDELRNSIEITLEKHCTCVPQYNRMLNNIYLLRDCFSGNLRRQLDVTLLERIDDTAKTKELRNDLNKISIEEKQESFTDYTNERITDYVNELCFVYEPDSNGIAYRMFVDFFIYSTEVVRTVSPISINNNNPESRLAGIRESLLESKGYKDLIDTLNNANWSINDNDLYLHCLIIERSGRIAVLYLFNETKKDAWLADEERFMDEDPLWFSEDSHVVSPVFRVKQHSLAQQNKHCRKFVVMMPPTYVINAEDMKSEKEWEDVTVVKLSYLLNSLESSQDLPSSTEYKDLSDPQNTIRDVRNRQAVQNEAIKSIKAKKEEEKKRIEIEFTSPWNLALLFKDYSSSFDGKRRRYKPEDSVLYKVLQVMGPNPLGVRIQWAELLVYFYSLPIKFCMHGVFDEDDSLVLTHFANGDSFLVDEYRDSELTDINPQTGCDGVDAISVVGGDIAEEECSIIYRFRPDDSFRKLRKEQQLQIRLDLGRHFRDVLTDPVKIGTIDKWQGAITRVSRELLSAKIKQLAEKNAKTAIMSRNMSHNLGSHVMAYLKRDLFSVSDILQKGVLQEFYPFVDAVQSSNATNIEDIIRLLEDRNKTIEMPFLVGLGRFISYLQERQDFIATVATGYYPFFSDVNFKDDVYDALNPDYRFFRHSDRKGGRPENLLMKYIALSEGLSRDSKATPAKERKNNIVIKFRRFDGINDYRDQENRGILIPRGVGYKDLEAMRSYSISIPGGIVGRQALFSILENLIRNSAKHGSWQRGKDNLEFTYDLINVDSLVYDNGGQSLYSFLCEEPEWASVITNPEEWLSDYLILTLTDNLITNELDYAALKLALKEEYVDENGVFIDNHKGIKEIRICASWLRGIEDDLHLRAGEPPVVTVRLVNGHLQYIFCIYAPVKVIAVVNNIIEEKEQINYYDVLQWAWQDLKGWKIMTPEQFRKKKHKSADVILVRGEELMASLESEAPDRLVQLDDGLFYEIMPNHHPEIPEDPENPNAQWEFKDEGYVFNKLLSKSYGVDLADDYPILISDGKTPNPESMHINLVSSDSLVEGTYRFAYRAHHQFEPFIEYMQGSMCKSMISIEGITGGNSTDRLIRNEKLNDAWYIKHLHALRARVAIFDERLFSKVTGLDDAQLVSIPQGGTINASRNALIYAQKRIWLFNVVSRPDNDGFDVYGFLGYQKSADGDYNSIIGRVARISYDTTDFYGASAVPCVMVESFGPDEYHNYKKWFDYISIHQGLMDKLYDALKLKARETYGIDIEPKDLERVMSYAKGGVSTSLYTQWSKLNATVEKPEDEIKFRHGLFIHSGRSKPSKIDMPQKLPFIQYAAIENAVYDCKYTLVELMKSALYE